MLKAIIDCCGVREGPLGAEQGGPYILCARALFTIIERCAAMGGRHGVVERAPTFASTTSTVPSRITSNKAACILSNGPR